jgi:transcriptional regulator with XRE-family HTH domain
MISKTKLKKLEAELKSFGITQEAQANVAKVTRVTLGRIFKGESKNPDAIERLIALRDKAIKKNKALEEAI